MIMPHAERRHLIKRLSRNLCLVACFDRGLTIAASPRTSCSWPLGALLPASTAWQATSRGSPRRRWTVTRIAQDSIFISSRMGMALRKAPAPGWLTATKRIASRQHLWLLRLPTLLPLEGALRPPLRSASSVSSSARASQLEWCTPEVYRRCAWCKNSLVDENWARGSSSAAGVSPCG